MYDHPRQITVHSIEIQKLPLPLSAVRRLCNNVNYHDLENGAENTLLVRCGSLLADGSSNADPNEGEVSMSRRWLVRLEMLGDHQ